MGLENFAHAAFGDQPEQPVPPEVRCVQPTTSRTIYRTPLQLGPPLPAPSTNTDHGKILTYSVASRAANALTGFAAPLARPPSLVHGMGIPIGHPLARDRA